MAQSNDSEFKRFSNLVSQMNNEIFTVVDVRRDDPQTVHVDIRFHSPPEEAEKLLDHPRQRVRIVTSLAEDEGPVYESPALEVFEFVATNGINESTCIGTAQDGALLINARNHF
ncbi:hypothetical protein AB8O55_22430 [Saccharopolyspora cebuensis]|uniref:Uncharacterized protein n=1 Tax=Saccharopolyspora cebuensis TaxID=418759 RepID=A0ABV4CM60_9PSEU